MGGFLPVGRPPPCKMPYVTRLTLQSGDRRALESVAEDIKETAARKGIQLKGPHPSPPTDLQVPQSRRLAAAGGEFEPWTYTVYERTVEIVGRDEVAADIARREFPPGVRVTVEVEQIRQLGRGG